MLGYSFLKIEWLIRENFAYKNSLSVENEDFNFRAKEVRDKYDWVQFIIINIHNSPKDFIQAEF